ncbi:33961_t:CDS:2 [Racocetra persica]|uniref:33961_t:CDS:1 n=1 Tax=Racocetra persica TaxID=160502 RepID=A0ACA9KSF0_9GLOM|nr:33961_t:CDS:2 [Racocetra persica]
MASTSSDTVSPVTSLNYRPVVSCNSSPRVSLKTSLTHPINWIVPEELIEGLSLDPLPATIDLFDVYTTASLFQHYYETVRNTSQTLQRRGSCTCYSPTLIGNLALSSCPGKKVRLNGPVRGRATIDRDLDLDFQRLKSSDISMVICCLNDEELAFLGVPWPKYCELAQKHNLQIIRIPMVEGGCPDTLDQMDQVVMQMDRHIQSGQRVLAHCRGGVGRAGLVACCWLLKTQFCCDADRAIRQVDFIVKYADYINRKPLSHHISHDVNKVALNTVTKLTQ